MKAVRRKSLLRGVAGYALAGGIGRLARRKRALTRGGSLATGLIGGTLFTNGPWGASAALVTFFVSSSALTRLLGGRDSRDSSGRNACQVLANGGVATLGSVLYRRTGDPGYLAVIGGALAAATADTWATEIGTRFGGTPRLVTTLKPVPKGSNGGVTSIGLAASVAGAITVSSVYARLQDIPYRKRLAASCAVGGVCASVADSVLGATVESEGSGRGLAFVNNDTVNLMNTNIGAAMAVIYLKAQNCTQRKTAIREYHFPKTLTGLQQWQLHLLIILACW